MFDNNITDLDTFIEIANSVSNKAYEEQGKITPEKGREKIISFLKHNCNSEFTLRNLSSQEETKESILQKINKYLTTKLEGNGLEILLENILLENFLFMQKFHNDFEPYNFKVIFPFDFKLAIKLFLLHNYDQPHVIQNFVDAFIPGADVE
ncbi:MAG: hypothetical protein K0R73_524 [Candidatus Midichloriaceae bacterium]|jgi:hypothetical protein|nr:hypothetical protein [Candidatus Midichloriaceae bacterium]